MRYMMLIHHDDEAMARAPKQELWAEYAAFNEALAKAGPGFAAGERLESADTATTIRLREGKTNVLDGPYADTKERFAGYFLIDVADLDEAIAWARRCPSAKYGAIEIRPFTPVRQWPSSWAQSPASQS